ISGNVPPGVEPRGGKDGPCARLGETKPVKGVFGPGTFVNESVRRLGEEFARRLGEQARQLVEAEFTRDVLQLALRYGLRGEPRVDDPDFVSKLVFDASKPAGTPKARFAYLFPNRNSALVQVRLKPDLGERER